MENEKAYRNQIVQLDKRMRQGSNHQCFYELSALRQCFGVALFKLLLLLLLKLKTEAFSDSNFE